MTNDKPKQTALDLVKHYSKIVYPYMGSSYLTGDEYPDLILERSKKEAKFTIQFIMNADMPYNGTNHLFAFLKKWKDVENCIDKITLEDLK